MSPSDAGHRLLLFWAAEAEHFVSKYSHFIGYSTAAIAALAILLPAPAKAEPDNGTFSMQVENDYFSLSNRDRHYSNGLRFSWLPTPSAPGDKSWIEQTAEAIPFVGDGNSVGRIGWSLGQSIFTPQDKTTTAALPNDRPYAGWLYAGLTLIKVPKPDPAVYSSINEMDTLEIDLGVVGRAALGEQVQNSFHSLAFGNQQARGWHNQLKSEPGLLISYDHKWRALAQMEFGHLGVDFTPSIGFDLGNVQVDASVGGMIRVGRDLPSDYGPPRIRPGLAGSDFFLSDSDTGRRFGWYLFAGAEGRAVAHNIFLDGNSFAKSLSVKKETLVADFQVGAAIIVYGVRITASEVIRTKEFVSQHGDDQFGSISLSTNF
jgi:lipid A 3-O-deacylase